MYCLQYSDPFDGILFMATNNLSYYSLEKSNLFLDSQLNYQQFLSIIRVTALSRTLKIIENGLYMTFISYTIRSCCVKCDFHQLNRQNPSTRFKCLTLSFV